MIRKSSVETTAITPKCSRSAPPGHMWNDEGNGTVCLIIISMFRQRHDGRCLVPNNMASRPCSIVDGDVDRHPAPGLAAVPKSGLDVELERGPVGRSCEHGECGQPEGKEEAQVRRFSM